MVIKGLHILYKFFLFILRAFFIVYRECYFRALQLVLSVVTTKLGAFCLKFLIAFFLIWRNIIVD